MGMPERSVTGRPLVPFSIGGPQKSIMGDSEQGVDRKPLSLCSILVSGPRLWQEVRTPFLKSTLTPKSQGASSALSGRWGEFRGHGSDDLSSPHLLLSALLYLWLVLTELRKSPVCNPKARMVERQGTLLTLRGRCHHPYFIPEGMEAQGTKVTFPGTHSLNREPDVHLCPMLKPRPSTRYGVWWPLAAGWEEGLRVGRSPLGRGGGLT